MPQGGELLVYWVLSWELLFVFLSLFLWSWYCLYILDLQLLIMPLASSNFSSGISQTILRRYAILHSLDNFIIYIFSSSESLIIYLLININDFYYFEGLCHTSTCQRKYLILSYLMMICPWSLRKIKIQR